MLQSAGPPEGLQTNRFSGFRKRSPAVHHLLFWALLWVLIPGVTIGGTAPRTSHEKGGEKAMTASEKMSDLGPILQLVIDLDKLQPYYHADTIVERKPLRILRNEVIPSDVPLKKFGQPVSFISSDQAGGRKVPYLEFTQINMAGETATVTFRYLVEGLAGNVQLHRTPEGWKVESSQITER
ncbi:MAG TPA: hypothetical protein DEO88_04490 [Syntrophobacteraceae bacterium]|nr:hypothetical protein [Syntrophobacteraceae bacterium]